MQRASKLPLLREQTQDRQVNKLQDNASQAAKALNAMPFASGWLSDPLTFTLGETKTIVHKLGRVPSGLIVVYALNAAPLLYFTADPSRTTASVKSDNPGTFRIWFY